MLDTKLSRRSKNVIRHRSIPMATEPSFNPSSYNLHERVHHALRMCVEECLYNLRLPSLQSIPGPRQTCLHAQDSSPRIPTDSPSPAPHPTPPHASSAKLICHSTVPFQGQALMPASTAVCTGHQSALFTPLDSSYLKYAMQVSGSRGDSGQATRWPALVRSLLSKATREANVLGIRSLSSSIQSREYCEGY